ncbi:AraC family transcriptional regulator [Paenibacillus sp. PAMC21692]|uniref:AraC family transcriptional regulator n=1 Tax=Paenibacillus sp. PAMC21692 TaxID=2762320 RepID=UPI00164E783D|nr:AraC family transcriptional regulator [Paenibacillus sp. PAMC21692]QNK56352.1 helix-turn-helix transcriptional regulator [Paenibacillus sp. PAMC21692]
MKEPRSHPVLQGNIYWNEDQFPLHVNREKEAFSLPLHCHDFVEINFVAEGRGMHYIAEDSLEVKRGDLFIIPTGTAHVYRPLTERNGNELIVYNCLFAPELIERLGIAFPAQDEVFSQTTRGERGYASFSDRNDEYRTLMQSLYREHVLRLPGTEAALLSLLMQLLISMHRNDKGGEESLSLRQLSPVFEHIAVHYQEPIALRTLAGLVSLSIPYLQRLFKRATGQTIVEYIQNLRIEKSCELLRHTEFQVQEIAYLSGYKDMKFFHRLFKKKTGTSPHQYRQSVLNQTLNNLYP